MPEAHPSHPHPAGGRHAGERRRKAVAALRVEIEKIIERIVFLWVIFSLFEIMHALVLAQQHVNYLPHGLALINAIVMSKVLLIAEELNFARRFHESRLIYSILYKAAMFSILFLVVHFIEETIKGMLAGQSLGASLPQSRVLLIVGCKAALLFITLTPYFAFREVGRVIGEKRLNDLIFKRRPPVMTEPG